MGYWVAIWIAILLEECYIFRRKRGFDWDAWNERGKLPVGGAALVAFLVGWAGAILCMSQVWYVGPIAREVGEFGADVSFSSLIPVRVLIVSFGTDFSVPLANTYLQMGNYVGFGWAALVYPPLRYYEFKRFGR
jgi:purine-cytosine permease-like protein